MQSRGRSLPPSVAVPITCPGEGCGRRYLVWTGVGAWGDFERAKEIAAQEGRAFVDACSSPFTYCGCGEPLDFTEGTSGLLM
jgi:hypothetical protein